MKAILRPISSLLVALLAMLISTPVLLVAQVSQDSLPSGSLLHKRAPEYAQWKVAVQYLTKTEMENAGADAALKKENSDAKGTPVMEQTITKTRDIICVERLMGNKERWVNWIQGSIEILVWPDGKNCAELASGTRDTPNPHHVDFNTTDFPGFEWISASTFKGVKDYKGTKCMFFEGKGSFAVGSDGKPVLSEAIAYIELSTRLPVALKYDSRLLLYTWNAPPTRMLTLPSNVQSVMEVRTKAAKDILTNAVTPY